MNISSYGRKLYTNRPINGHFSTAGCQGPICPEQATTIIKKGLQWISKSDKFFREFSVTNPQIASVSERWYGRDIAQRALLGNASDRHRCIVDMIRNNDGGLFRAIFSNDGQLKKTLSIAKDKSSVSTVYKMGHIDGKGLTNFSKKTVRSANGEKLKEVYTASDYNNPKNFFSFIIDTKKGLKKIISSDNGILIFKEGTIVKPGKPILPESVAGVDENLKDSLINLKTQGWVKFLENTFKTQIN